MRAADVDVRQVRDAEAVELARPVRQHDLVLVDAKVVGHADTGQRRRERRGDTERVICCSRAASFHRGGQSVTSRALIRPPGGG